MATQALAIDRQSLPSLLLAAHDVSYELQRIAPDDPAARDFAQHIAGVAEAARHAGENVNRL